MAEKRIQPTYNALLEAKRIGSLNRDILTRELLYTLWWMECVSDAKIGDLFGLSDYKIKMLRQENGVGIYECSALGSGF